MAPPQGLEVTTHPQLQPAPDRGTGVRSVLKEADTSPEPPPGQPQSVLYFTMVPLSGHFFSFIDKPT